MPDPDATQTQGPQDLFAIRSRLVQTVNPLRAKIALFSIVYHPFADSNADWSALKQRDLGEFIRRAYLRYDTLEDLRAAFEAVAVNRADGEELMRAAKAIVRELASQYENLDNTATTVTEVEDASQTWDIPVGVSLQKAVANSLPVADSASSFDAAVASGQSISAALDTSPLSEDTATTVAEEAGAVTYPDPLPLDAELTEDIEDDNSEFDDDRSRWLDEPPAAIGTVPIAAATPPPHMLAEQAERQQTQNKKLREETQTEKQQAAQPQEPQQPVIEQQSAKQEPPSPDPDPDISNPFAEPEDDRAEEPEPQPPAQPKKAEIVDPEPTPEPKPEPSRAKSRSPQRERLSLVRVLSDEVSARDAIDAIVQRYSQNLIEQVTTALDDLEEELAECLADRNLIEATPIAGEALGRVLFAVSRSIAHMQHTLEDIPGVEPLAHSLPIPTEYAPAPTPPTETVRDRHKPIEAIAPSAGEPDRSTETPLLEPSPAPEDIDVASSNKPPTTSTPVTSAPEDSAPQDPQASTPVSLAPPAPADDAEPIITPIQSGISTDPEEQHTPTRPGTADAPNVESNAEPSDEPSAEPSAESSDEPNAVKVIHDRFQTILAKRDMVVRVKPKNGCLHLIVEATPLPERAKLVRFVTKTLRDLDLPDVTMRLHGRQKDARAFDWSADLPPSASTRQSSKSK